MVRSMIAVVLGVVVALVVIVALEGVGTLIYPPPADTDWNNPESFRKVVAEAPVGALLFVLLGYAVACLVGGFLAAWVGRRAQSVHALIIGGILMAMGIIDLIRLRPPTWFVVASLLAYLPPAYLGSRLAPRRPAGPQSPPAQSLAA
jgi:hypothetical protein